MSLRAVESVRAARSLYEEAKKAQLGFGCFEVSLRALGGEDIHYLDILNRDEKHPTDLVGEVARRGLAVNWIIRLSPDITGQDFEVLFQQLPSSFFEEHHPQGFLMGYLCLETYYSAADEHNNHALAILPREIMPRNTRRSLKKHKSYIAVDTSVGGVVRVSVDNLAHYVAHVSKRGGTVDIAQIRKSKKPH